MVKLSAIVCVQNQEAGLAACLRKLSFCDEIVVVADRCTDRSQEIARRHGAVVVDGIFPLESQRKQAAVEAASGDWILEVEPEELIDPALAWEIRVVLQMRQDGDHYQLPIDNYVGDVRVRHGWAGPLSAASDVRLYKRGLKAWEARRVNAPAVLAGHSGGALKGAIRRRLGDDVGGLVSRLDGLTRLAAEDLADRGEASRPMRDVLRGAGLFVQGYLARGGWREGRLGLVSAALAALAPLLTGLRTVDVAEARAARVEAPQPAPRDRRVVGL